MGFSLSRARLASKYIFFEMLPSFILGVLVFLFILLMFQALRLTEFVLIHGVPVETILKMVGYMMISFLPVILPMSLLFSVLLTYGRLSADSEIVALRSLGLNMTHLTAPAIFLAIVMSAISAQTAFSLAPWGNRKFEVLIDKLGRLKASATIKEGVFSEGFFDLVVYANDVDEGEGILHKVFIYDERDRNSPLTIIAKQGMVVKTLEEGGHSALLRLIDGDIHRTAEGTYTKISFDSYDINLFDPIQKGTKEKTTLSHTLEDLREKLSNPELPAKERRAFGIELHRRWALAFVCVVFAFLGVGLGTSTNRRSGKSSGMVLCIGVIVSYWILFIIAESLAKNGHLPPWLAMWIVNFVFSGFAFYSLSRTGRQT